MKARTLLALAAAAIFTGASAGTAGAADDNSCFSNPALCTNPVTPLQTCLVNGRGPAPNYASYGNYFSGQYPYASLSASTRADLLTLMNNVARSFGFPADDPDINWNGTGDALGGYYKWYPHPSNAAGDPYGFGLVLWNNTTRCAYVLPRNDTLTPYTSVKVADKYASLGYERGALGLPTSNPVSYTSFPYNTTWQRFTNGYVTYRPGDAAAFYVGGTSPAARAMSIRYGWDFDLGSGLNRFPLSMDAACVNSVYAGSCGVGTSGYYIKTNDGLRTILARKTASTAFMVGGDLSNRALAPKWYATYGTQPWLGALGFPKGEEAVGRDAVGHSQAFEGGDLLWTPASGAHLVRNGPIRDEWNRRDREDGALGYPIQDTPAAGSPADQAFMKGHVTTTAQGTVSIADSNGRVPNVAASFARIASDNAPLSFYSTDPNTGYDHMGGVSLFEHIQGAQRIGRNRFVLSSSHDGEMYFATLGSKAGSSAHQLWGGLSSDPDLDYAYSTLGISNDRPHIGGIQAVGDFVFAVASHPYCNSVDPTCSNDSGSYLTVVDTNPPARVVWTQWHPGKVYNAVGATKRLDGTYLIATLGAGDNDIFFSTTTTPDIKNGATTAITPLYHWNYGPDSTFYPDGSSAYGIFASYQSINLVTQGNGEIFLIGTEQHGWPAEDWVSLWRVDACSSGRQPSCSCTEPTEDVNRVCLTSISARHMYLSDDVYGDFDGGAGIYINPLGGSRDLILYSTEKSNGGVQWGISEF
jgi:hypothetical protein